MKMGNPFWTWSFKLTLGIPFSPPAFCNVLGTSLNDRCRTDSDLTGGVPGTRTVQQLISLFDPLGSIFEMAGYWKRSSNQSELHSNRAPKALTLSLLPSLCRLHALLSFSLNWFDTKMHQFLASWSLEPFLLLMQWDLSIFLESVKKALFLVQTLCVVQDDSSSWNSLSVYYDRLQEQRNSFEVGSQRMFPDSFYLRFTHYLLCNGLLFAY